MCFFFLFLFFPFHSYIGWEEFGRVQDSDIFFYPEIKYGFIFPRFSWNNRRTGREREGKHKNRNEMQNFSKPDKWTSKFTTVCEISTKISIMLLMLMLLLQIMKICQLHAKSALQLNCSLYFLSYDFCAKELRTVVLRQSSLIFRPQKVFRICFISSLYLISRLRSLSNFFHSISENFLMCTYTQLKWSLHCSSSSCT